MFKLPDHRVSVSGAMKLDRVMKIIYRGGKKFIERELCGVEYPV